MDGSEVCHYLEMSANILGESEWYPKYSHIDGKEGLGYGKSNTYRILQAKTSDALIEENCAAYRCSKYSTSNTKAGNWFLPRKGELNLMYKNQKEKVLATCEDTITWSSSPASDDENLAWAQLFGYGNQDYDFKNGRLSVRAVRAF